jgi:GT2 family glycosyltransferase
MSDASSFDVTLGIVAYRRPGALRSLLSRVTGGPSEVLVVNVDGDPDVSAVVRAYASVREIVIANRGYAAGVNAIAREARRQIVVFANDDVEMCRGAVERLASPIRRGDADVVVPQLVGADGAIEPTVRALPTLRSLFVEWALLPDRPNPLVGRLAGVQKWRRPSRAARIEAATAAVVATRRDLLRDEPLPEEYFLYWEELEWFWRLRERSAIVQLDGLTQVTRWPGRDDQRAEKSVLMARNAVRCVRRTQGRTRARLALPIVVLWQLRLVMTAGIRARSVEEPRRLLDARLAGLSAAFAWKELR